MVDGINLEMLAITIMIMIIKYRPILYEICWFYLTFVSLFWLKNWTVFFFPSSPLGFCVSFFFLVGRISVEIRGLEDCSLEGFGAAIDKILFSCFLIVDSL